MACSHGRSYEYFAESIISEIGFESYTCPNSQIDYRLDKCNKTDTILMGDPVPRDARGKYYLTTNDQPPFAMALNS